MKIYQPMLFVGLGGTGCKVGAEFERRLREELCGPDGTRLLEDMRGRDYLPYQLPSCLQFVYADLSSAELARVRREVIPGIEHEVAAQRTMRTITDLVPARLANSAEVAQSLRLHLCDEEVGWLPPKVSDPRIGPLHAGAGQLPTVGRAVLFETLRRNVDTTVKGIKDALADINESAGDLHIVSGERSQRVDPVTVFVVFSVAGGTGSGIFYDYLHLIGAVLQDGHKQFQIYPLVLMPSAFDDGKGGGRPAELNAGSALIDLFRLIDDQNAQGSPDRVSTSSGHDNAVAVRYPPPRESVKLNPNTVQTAFLFGRPVGGVKRDDLT
ncbi:MAG: tubulin-like doman-containing protein, partial [Pseudonocardiaceae bacterium]